MTTVLLACDPSYIADSADPRLPHFTTLGRNAAGAYLNGEPWVVVCDHEFPCYDHRLWYNAIDDRTELHFAAGVLRHGGMGFSDPLVTMRFYLEGHQMDLINSLAEGQVLTYNVDGALNVAELSMAYRDTSLSFAAIASSGLLHIRHVEVIQSSRKIVAGTFGFVVDDNHGMYTVRSGRFDFVFP